MGEEAHSFGNSDLGQGLGCAAVILAILLGVGGCQLMIDCGHALHHPEKAQVVVTPQTSAEPIQPARSKLSV